MPRRRIWAPFRGGCARVVEYAVRQPAGPRWETVRNPLHFPRPMSEGVRGGTDPGRPLSAAWMTHELIEEKREVWSRAHGRDVQVHETIDMLAGLRQLAGVLLGAMREERASPASSRTAACGATSATSARILWPTIQTCAGAPQIRSGPSSRTYRR